MSFEDKNITCVDCGQEFVHSAEDQGRYAERGFTNEPKRCRQCREQRKAQGGRRQGGGGGGGGRPPRETYEVVCAECGATTTVPFKPTEGRPVYCRDCFQAKRQ
ncbi:MAG: zinc-ribbon domain containing protein [Phycisphaerae bacterium]|nr:zinc-ribbon domain containing protein [Phycisphaerae bacterium]